MRELLSNNSLFLGQLYEDKSLAMHARDLIITQQFTAAGADLFLNSLLIVSLTGVTALWSLSKTHFSPTFAHIR